MSIEDKIEKYERKIIKLKNKLKEKENKCSRSHDDEHHYDFVRDKIK